MKRYWKLISLVTAIVLVIGIFYIQTAFATNSYPSFIIKTEQGNKEELAGVSFEGVYYHQGYAVGEGLKISSDGSEYYSERSIIDYLFGYTNDAEIKRLQEEYRSFMRGKWPSLSSFYEDDDRIAYADISSEHDGYMTAGDFTFSIDILNKNTNETYAHQIEIPNESGFYYIGVEDVHVVGDVVKVFTNNRGNEKIENHVYSVDIQTGNLLEDEIIITAEEHVSSNRWKDIYIMNSYRDKGNSEYVLYKVLVTEHVESEEYPYGYEEQTIDHFISYHVETGEINEFELPELEFLSNQVSPYQDASTVSGSTAYFSVVTEKGIEITPYSLKDGEIKKSNFVEFESRSESAPIVKINEDRLYMIDWVSNKNVKASAVVADIKSGEIIYQGTIEMENKEDEPLDYEFHFNDIVFN